MEKAPLQDASLVAQVLDLRASEAERSQAFERLVERYQGRLFALARHYVRSAAEVEDIVQDVFLKAFSRLASFQHNSSFYTWLYRIALNTILDRLKRRGRSPVQSVEDPELAAEGTGDERNQVSRPDADLERSEIIEITRAVLDELPEIFKTVLILRELEGHAYQEIADHLGISIGTVESRLFRARARFKLKLAQMYPEFAVPEEGA